MGSSVAAGFAEAVNDGLITLERALEYHLRHNHFPPVHTAWLPIAKELIEEATSTPNYEIREWGMELIDNPIREDETITKRKVMEALHLWDFVV